MPRAQLLTKEPMDGDAAVCSVAKDSTKKSFRLVEAVVDSVAEVSVTPPQVFPVKVEPSAMSRAGGRYKAANSARIPNLGQKRVKIATDEGHACGVGFQIAEFERP